MLEIREIQIRLDDQFIPLEPMLSGLRLIPSELTTKDIDRCQQELNISLPKEYESILLSYDLGRFTIGPIAFCNTGNILGWLKNNNQDNATNEYPWWGSGARPVDQILIANSDFYAVLLNCDAGTVSVFEHGKLWSDHKIIVATTFELFVRGLGTVFLNRGKQADSLSLADEVATCVGGGQNNAFWQWFAE